MQLEALPERNFSYTFFPGNFQSNCCFKQIFREEHYHVTLAKPDSTTDVPRRIFRLFSDSYFTKEL